MLAFRYFAVEPRRGCRRATATRGSSGACSTPTTLYAFEIAAVILLVAIVAAIALTLRRRKDSRYQDPSEQVRARREERVQAGLDAGGEGAMIPGKKTGPSRIHGVKA